MRENINGGVTTSLVSHSLPQVRALCSKILWLHKGNQIAFGDDVQGNCKDGYTAVVERMPEGTEVRLDTDFLRLRRELSALAETVVYTGPIDAYFDYRLGALEYRSLRFETEMLDFDNYQVIAAVLTLAAQERG